MKNKNIFNLGIMILLFIFLNMLITATLFIFKISITNYNFILSLFITISIYILKLLKEKNNYKSILLNIFIFLIIIFSTIFISGKIYDSAFDSNTYHKTAIGALKYGWNPIYENIEDFNTSEKNEIHIENPVYKHKNFQKTKEMNDVYANWTNHYAKGTWFYAANLYKITDNIETGKSITLLTIIATFILLYAYLNTKIYKSYSFIISILLAINPVIIYQMFTYYNDGLIGNYVILLLLSLTIMIDEKSKINKKDNYLLYFLILTILINIKFTGFAYAGIYSLFYYIFIIKNKKQRKENFKNLTIIAIISILIGVLLIGLSTYPKNIQDHGHPFHPLYGDEKVDIMTINTPKKLLNMNRIKKLIYSNFSKSSNTNTENQEVELKIPFTFQIKELENFKTTDTRIGGYGVIFGGILLLSLGAGVYIFTKAIKEKKKIIIYLLPIISTLFLTIILEDAWWARYMPQLYTLPIIIAIMLAKTHEIKLNKILLVIILSTLIFNSYLILNVTLEKIMNYHITIKKQLSLIPADKNDEVLVYINEYTGTMYNIRKIFPKAKQTLENQEIDGYDRYLLFIPNHIIYVKKEG